MIGVVTVIIMAALMMRQDFHLTLNFLWIVNCDGSQDSLENYNAERHLDRHRTILQFHFGDSKLKKKL